MIMDLFDDFAGPLDLLDRLESWLTFAFAPYSRKSRYGRLNLVQMAIPRADKMQEQGKPAVTLRETMEYLSRYGIVAKCNGFDSRYMYFQVRKDQENWARYLLSAGVNGIPQLDYSRQSWADKKRKQQAQRQSQGWLDWILG